MGLGVITALGAANFAAYIGQASPPFPCRLAHVTVIAGYAAVALAVSVRVIFRAPWVLASIFAAASAVAVVGGEAALGWLRQLSPDAEVIWVGGSRPDAVLGEMNPPYSKVKTLHPVNPRGYFEPHVPLLWQLDVHDAGSEAVLEVQSESAPRLRVAIRRADDPTAYNIQLRKPGLEVGAGEAYSLRFRARADAPRRISLGLSMAHAPWEGLGFFREVEIGTGWQEFQFPVEPTRGDANAQLHFDLGAGKASVELEQVVLQKTATGALVEPPKPPTRYAVSYDFNGLGCRGPDYPIPAEAGRQRILALGDSYTMGVGVHQRDTFAGKLEQSLNAGGGAFDVINCGVSGYATREARLFYERTTAVYQPDVVLLAMVDNDDISWPDELRLGYVHFPTKFERLFLSASHVQRRRIQRRHVFDYSSSMKELLDLATAARDRNARLAVVTFRADNGPAWDLLSDALTATLGGTDVPVLDLGPSLFREHSVDELNVHDGHPNEIAHGIAAAEIERFLRGNGLIR